MEKKRIIFDLDGVLIDKMDFSDSVKKALIANNVSFNDDEVEKYIYAMKTYEKFYNYYTVEDYLDYIKMVSRLKIDSKYMEYFLHHPEDLLPYESNDKVEEVLKYLYSKYNLVVLTNYFRCTQLGRLKCLSLDKYFEKVYGGEKYIKPHEKAFLEACGKYSKEECIMIGDTFETDIKGAINVGMDYIYLNPLGSENTSYEVNDLINLKKIL